MCDQTYEAYIQQGLLSSQKQNYQRSEHYLNLAKEAHPSHWESWYYMGCLYEIQEFWGRAQKEFEQALLLKGHSCDIYLHLGYLSGCQSRWKASIAYYQKALDIEPQNWEVLYELANAYYYNHNHSKARQFYQKALEFKPESGLIHYQLALISLNQEDYPTCIALLLKTLNFEAQLQQTLPIHYNLGLAHYKLGQFSQAITHFQHSSEHITESLMIGHCYRESGQLELALSYYLKAQKLALSPSDKSEVLSAQASILEKNNQLEQAHKTSLLALKLSTPLSTLETYATICLRSERFSEAIECLSSQLNMSQLQPFEKRTILFRLAHLYDRAKQYAQAFQCLQEANDLKVTNYSPLKQELFVQEMCTYYSKKMPLPEAQIKEPKMIFIVGLPRSGSTLIEQILDSHSQVFGAGELKLLPHLTRNFDWTQRSSQTKIEALSLAYHQKIQALSQASVVVDKMLLNYQYLGLISQLFPDSKIIHCQRHPLDICLSCYFHDFIGNLDYTYQLESLGHYYLQYEKLMNFWTLQLPNPILSIAYENLVTHSEHTIKSLLNFCDLEPETQCFHFFENPNKKLTASYAQVQQPIYTHSIHRYKYYLEQLEPLRKILRPIL